MGEAGFGEAGGFGRSDGGGGYGHAGMAGMPGVGPVADWLHEAAGAPRPSGPTSGPGPGAAPGPARGPGPGPGPGSDWGQHGWPGWPRYGPAPWDEPERPANARLSLAGSVPWIVAGLLAALLITSRAPAPAVPPEPQAAAATTDASGCVEPLP